MKETMISFSLAMSISACSMFSGLTAKSSEQECVDTLTKAVNEFCPKMKDNIDKVNAAAGGLKALGQ